MENTTKMYIEHIVIGMQTTMLIIFVFLCLDPALKLDILNLSTVMELVVVIPIAYALGILIDRLSKLVIGSDKMEEDIKRKACIKATTKKLRKSVKCKKGKNCDRCKLNKVSRQVWSEFDEMEYYNDARTRKRILRATCFNSGLGFLIVLVLLICGNTFLSLVSSVILLFVLFIISVGCFIMYRLFLREYYEKQKKYLKLFCEIK